MRRTSIMIAWVGVLVAMSCLPAWPAAPVRIFAAASLANAMEEVAAVYRRSADVRLKIVAAGSSVLARQIEAGAEADIFISADKAWVDYLVARRLVIAESRQPLLANRLALVTPAEGVGLSGVDALQSWFDRNPHARLAVGDPAHVPVGRYAKAALERLGAWTPAAARLIAAPDTRAALALVERGEAQIGIVYHTDARAASRVRIVGLLPGDSHPPITYPIAMVRRDAGGAIRAAYDFLCGPIAARVFAKHGFLMK